MKLRALAAVSAALACLVGPGGNGPVGITHAFAADDSDDAVIARGVALRKEGDDQAARDLFQKVYERSHSARSAGQLGLAEQALGRWEEAEAHLREALRSPNDPWVKKNHDALSRDMLLIKSHIARVEILGEPDGAEVMVNGRTVGHLPLPGPISITAGEVDVETRAPGYQHEVRKLSLTGGQYQRLMMRLQKVEPAQAASTAPAATAIAVPVAPAETPPPAASTSPPVTAQPPPDQPSLVRPVAKWTAVGLSGAGLALGIASTVIRANKLDQFKSAQGGTCVEMGGRAVNAMDGTPVPACQGLLDSYNSMRTWQIVGFVSAGVFAATWLALFLTEPAPPAEPHSGVARTHSFVCAPTADATGAGATCLFSM